MIGREAALLDQAHRLGDRFAGRRRVMFTLALAQGLNPIVFLSEIDQIEVQGEGRSHGAQDYHFLTRRRVPHPRCLVLTCRDDTLTIRRERRTALRRDLSDSSRRQ